MNTTVAWPCSGCQRCSVQRFVERDEYWCGRRRVTIVAPRQLALELEL
jgi:hypothetical protein